MTRTAVLADVTLYSLLIVCGCAWCVCLNGFGMKVLLGNKL